MTLIRAVFTRGVEVNFEGDAWRVANSASGAVQSFDSLPSAREAIEPLLPVLVTDAPSYGALRTLMLRKGADQYYGIGVSDLLNRKHDSGFLFMVYHLTYLLGAVNHHCQNMAEQYVGIASTYANFPTSNDDSKSESGIFSYQTEPYFEFDAAIGAARRAYDSLRYPLWKKFGPNKGSVPSSLSKLLKVGIDLPLELGDQLSESWAEYGRTLKDYRDCVNHYVPVDFGMGSAFMQVGDSGAWTTTIRIPDNPHAKSKLSFTFDENKDALDYAWNLADELLSVSTAVVESIAPGADQSS